MHCSKKERTVTRVQEIKDKNFERTRKEMRYIIECPYCGAHYTEEGKENKERFVCQSCGAANNKEHVLKRLNGNTKVFVEENDDLQTIKNYNSAEHPLPEYESWEYNKYGRPRYTKDTFIFQLLAPVLVVVFGLAYLTTENGPKLESIWHGLFSEEAQLERVEKKEAEASEEYEQCKKSLEGLLYYLAQEDIETTQNYFTVAPSKYFDASDLKKAIDHSFMESFWGTETTYTYMECVDWSDSYDYMVFDVIFSNSTNRNITFEKCEDGYMRIVPNFMLVQNTVVRASSFSNVSKDEVSLFIDEEEIDLEPNIYEDKFGTIYIEYVIPVIIDGEHELVINTAGRSYSGKKSISKDEEEITLR